LNSKKKKIWILAAKKILVKPVPNGFKASYAPDWVLIGGFTLYFRMTGHFMYTGEDFPHFVQEVSLAK